MLGSAGSLCYLCNIYIYSQLIFKSDGFFMHVYICAVCMFIYIYASFPHFLPGVCGSRSIPSGTARMPKGKGKNNTEESDESEYTEVTDEGPEEAA